MNALTMGDAALAPDREAAEEFLRRLDPKAKGFTFQTADDRPGNKRPALAQVLRGSFADRAVQLAQYSEMGAAIYVTINETDGSGRRKGKNIVRVRALFADLDDAPLDNHKRLKLAPNLIVTSSPGKGHVYWRVQGVGLDEAPGFQKRLAKLMDGDPAVSDLPRVMRLPGFAHQKGKSFMVTADYHDAPVYSRDEFLAALEAAEAEHGIASGNDPRAGKTAGKSAGKGVANALAAAAIPGFSGELPEFLKGQKPLDAGKQFSDEPADAAAIANQCGQMRLMRDKRGAIEEPLWHAAIGVLSWAEGGDDIVHDWSKGHPHYDRKQTEGYIERAKKISGPTTCDHFSGLNPEGCKGCRFRGHITTPLQLGRGRWGALPAPTVPPPDEGDTAAPAATGVAAPSPAGVTINDFWAFMEDHTYIWAPTGAPWPAVSVNACLPPMPNGLDADGNAKWIKPNIWLDQNRAVHQMTWAPGFPALIEGVVINQAGWEERKGCRAFNLYRPPSIIPGDANQAGPWLAHVGRLFGQDAEHVVRWLAHRVQKPHEKINHALLLGGAQGIGKDTILEPVKDAVGPWNFQEIGPQQLLGRFNGFAKSVILRISEIRDLGDGNRFEFYNSLKKYAAAPPDRLQVDEKNTREYLVSNVCGVVITANEKNFHLPPDDRRHFIAWSPLPEKALDASYFKALYDWYDRQGGRAHVTAFLRSLSLSSFDPKAPPPRTDAWHDIVGNGASPDDAELADALEAAGNPEVITPSELAKVAGGTDLYEFLTSKKTRSLHRHRFGACGYTRLRNSGAKDGLWKIGGKRQVVYAREGLSKVVQLEAAERRYKVKKTGGEGS